MVKRVGGEISTYSWLMVEKVASRETEQNK